MEFKFNLGDKVRDKYTSYEGWVHGLSVAITGCNQVCVSTRTLDEKGAPKEGVWLDDTRVDLVEATPVKAPASHGGFTAGEMAGLRNS